MPNAIFLGALAGVRLQTAPTGANVTGTILPFFLPLMAVVLLNNTRLLASLQDVGSEEGPHSAPKRPRVAEHRVFRV